MFKLKSAILLFCLGLSSTTIFSQKIFREGYIIKNSGETFEGLVSYSPGKKIPEKCVFKRFDIAVEITYTPEIIKAFGYKNGRRFETIFYKGKKSFIETLVSGDLTLYTSGTEYFVRKSGTEIKVLKGPISWEDENGARTFNNPEEWMRYLAGGTPMSAGKEADLKKDLIPLVVEYNSKAGTRYVVYKRTVSEKELTANTWHSNSNSNSFGIVGGLSFYSLSLSPERHFYLPVPEREFCPVFGISYERVLSRKSDKLTAHTELLYHNQTFYSFSEELDYNGHFTKNDAFFDYKAVKVPVLLKYTFSNKRIKPFVSGGLAGTFFLQSDYLHIIEDEDYFGTSIEINEDRQLAFKPYELSAVAGAGINFRFVNTVNLRLEGRLEYGTGIFSTEGLPFKQHSVQQSVLLGIVF
ncbi:MAG TPA: hypothetical protein VK207_07050 [Bacteroidales bacterium]|nr:hypothetical protein [Bacteroidales bacterium]